MMQSQILVVFDFDNTITNENTDTIIYNLLPSKQLPRQVKDQYQKGFWTIFMQTVFNYLYQQGVTKADLKNCVKNCPIAPGMIELLQFIQQNQKLQSIIVSDSNTLFIEWILKQNKVKVSEVFTNPAKFNAEGLLTIQECHSHQCQKCPRNICKQEILKQFLSNHQYNQIIYVGDGENDFCPVALLRENDVVCARKGFSLEKILKKQGKKNVCQVMYYENGLEILSNLQEL